MKAFVVSLIMIGMVSLGAFAHLGHGLASAANGTISFLDIHSYQRPGVNRLKSHLHKNQIGQSSDYMLQVLNNRDEWQDYILIFGHSDDAEACQRIAEVLPYWGRRGLTNCVKVN